MIFRSIALTIILFLFALSLTAAETSVHGFVDTYHGVGVSEPRSYISSRTRARVEASIKSDQTGAFVSFNAVKNGIVESEDGFNLHEAYLSYYSDYLELTAGKQIIIWGAADGFAVTDIVSPKDYSEFLARDFDDMRLGVDSVRMRYLGGDFTLEGVFIPVFTPAEVPYTNDLSDEDNPWAYDLGSAVLTDPDLPGTRISNSEYGLRGVMRNSSFDAALSCLYTWEDMGVLRMNEEGEFYQKYYRMLMVGSEVSVPVSEVVVRAECALYAGKHYAEDDITEDTASKNVLNSIIGVDYSPGDNWSLSTQIYNVTILAYSDDLSSDQYTTYHTVSVSKKVLRETLTLSTMLFYGYVNGDYYDRTYASYVLTDDLSLTAGLDLFGGEGGSFGAHKDNSQVFGKIKYGF